MDSIKTRAIVARRADYKEANCMLTLFAEGLGVISACCYGVKSKKSSLRAIAQPLCFAEFVLSKGTGDIYSVTGADMIESFYPISEDIEKLALAGYFLEITGDIFSAEDNAPLSLLLNTLYAIAYKNVENSIAKAVFELKMMQYSGYEPALSACIKCGKEEAYAFSVAGGAVCSSCKTQAMPMLSKDVKAAMEYILKSDTKRIFAFELSKPSAETLAKMCEAYVLNKSDKRYKSLEYYKKLM